MAEKYHDDWEVVPFNLNMEPVEDPDARALVPANTERQLEAVPLSQRSSAQSYHAQPVLTAPPQPLLLKGSSSKTKTTIKVPIGTRILPPRPNEMVVGVKTNRSGEISSIRYTTKEERAYFEGIRASKVRFIPPKAAPKHSLLQLALLQLELETPPKRRKTIMDIDEEVCRLDRVIIDLQSSINSLTRQLSNHNTIILGLR